MSTTTADNKKKCCFFSKWCCKDSAAQKDCCDSSSEPTITTPEALRLAKWAKTVKVLSALIILYGVGVLTAELCAQHHRHHHHDHDGHHHDMEHDHHHHDHHQHHHHEEKEKHHHHHDHHHHRQHADGKIADMIKADDVKRVAEDQKQQPEEEASAKKHAFEAQHHHHHHHKDEKLVDLARPDANGEMKENSNNGHHHHHHHCIFGLPLLAIATGISGLCAGKKQKKCCLIIFMIFVALLELATLAKIGHLGHEAMEHFCGNKHNIVNEVAMERGNEHQKHNFRHCHGSVVGHVVAISLLTLVGAILTIVSAVKLLKAKKAVDALVAAEPEETKTVVVVTTGNDVYKAVSTKDADVSVSEEEDLVSKP